MFQENDYEIQLLHYSCAMAHMYYCMDMSNECSGVDLKSVYSSLTVAVNDYLVETIFTEEEAIESILKFMGEHFLVGMYEEDVKYLTALLQKCFDELAEFEKV